MLEDLYPRLETIGKLDVLVAVAGEVDNYYAARPEVDEARDGHRRVIDLQHLGEVRETQDDIAGAIADQRRALAIAERMDPAAPVSQQDVAASHINVGRLLRDDPAAALQELHRAQTLAEAMAPGLDARKLLARCHYEIGEKLAPGNAVEALEELQTAEAIQQGIVTADPSDRGQKRFLSRAEVAIADLLDSQYWLTAQDDPVARDPRIRGPRCPCARQVPGGPASDAGAGRGRP